MSTLAGPSVHELPDDPWKAYQLGFDHGSKSCIVKRRRERIATAALQGICARKVVDLRADETVAADALCKADALITALDH